MNNRKERRQSQYAQQRTGKSKARRSKEEGKSYKKEEHENENEESKGKKGTITRDYGILRV